MNIQKYLRFQESENQLRFKINSVQNNQMKIKIAKKNP